MGFMSIPFLFNIINEGAEGYGNFFEDGCFSMHANDFTLHHLSKMEEKTNSPYGL